MKTTYEEMVGRLARAGGLIAAEMTAQKAHLWHMSSALACEAGELFDPIKQHVIYDAPLNINEKGGVLEELGDIEFYLEGLRQSLGITREEVLQANQDKLAIRHPGYTFTTRQASEKADHA